MTRTADDVALAVSLLADALPDVPTAEQVVPIVARLSRRERAVLALFFERLAGADGDPVTGSGRPRLEIVKQPAHIFG
ncbi:hypothetical protein [Leifsonia sp. fls2-241-R2A-40a]|uniref:hypothetical protein n=1 Tax=Leifsonia sp. fls2-241-R2A-40a TaxID=3040290 RepID=UPI00254C8ACA|nr:hypothetical protein [Leifsonia sp. fls2-241-R2A-40a]